MRITPRHPENLEGDHRVLVHPLPNLGHLGYVLGMVSPLHDADKFIRCWDCMVMTTQPPKLEDTLPLRPRILVNERLRQKCGQNRKAG